MKIEYPIADPHTLSADEIIVALDTDAELGLSPLEVKKRAPLVAALDDLSCGGTGASNADISITFIKLTVLNFACCLLFLNTSPGNTWAKG